MLTNVDYFDVSCLPTYYDDIPPLHREDKENDVIRENAFALFAQLGPFQLRILANYDWHKEAVKRGTMHPTESTHCVIGRDGGAIIFGTEAQCLYAKTELDQCFALYCLAQGTAAESML